MQAYTQTSSTEAFQFDDGITEKLVEERASPPCKRRRHRGSRKKQLLGISEQHVGIVRWNTPLPIIQITPALFCTESYPALTDTAAHDVSSLRQEISAPAPHSIRSVFDGMHIADIESEPQNVIPHVARWPSLSDTRPSLPVFCVPRQRTVRGRLEGDGAVKTSAENNVDPVLAKPVSPRPHPVSVMISTDFVISAPVRENLLLTIALRQQHQHPGEEESAGLVAESKGRMGRQNGKVESKGRVFVAHFSTRSPFTRFVLGRDASRVASEPNAGGQSVVSESLSMEYFSRKFGACNVVTEMEVAYENPHWKKVDYICDIFGRRVGVSVTRAMAYPDPHLFSRDMAKGLLYKKLYGLVVARLGVSSRYSFVTAVLHVWCETELSARMMQQEYGDMAKVLEVEEDVIMVLTVAEGGEAKPIFYEHCLRGAAQFGRNERGAFGNQHPWWNLAAKHERNRRSWRDDTVFC